MPHTETHFQREKFLLIVQNMALKLPFLESLFDSSAQPSLQGFAQKAPSLCLHSRVDIKFTTLYYNSLKVTLHTNYIIRYFTAACLFLLYN